MAQMRRVFVSLLARNSDRTIAGTVNATDYGSAQVEVLRAGTVVTSGGSLNAAASAALDVTGVQRVKVGDVLLFVQGGVAVTASPLTVTAVDPTAPTISVTNGGSTVSYSAYDRLALQPAVSGHRATVYSDPYGTAGALTNPIALGSDGLAEFYSHEAKVDLYVTGTNLTSKWFFGYVTEPMETIHVPIGVSAAEFQSIVDEAVDRSARVVLEDGTYSLDAAITLKAVASGKLVIDGQGRGSTDLLFTADTAGFILGTAGSPVSNVTLRGFKLRSTGATAVTSAGVYDAATSGTTSRCAFEDIEVTGFYHGIRMGDQAEYTRFDGVYAHDNIHTGIWPGKYGTLTATCESSSNGTTSAHHGVYVDDGWDGVVIEGGRYNENAGTGIHCYNDTTPVDGLTIGPVECRGNGVAAGTCAGIIVSSDAATSIRNVVISGARCSATVVNGTDEKNGIYLKAVDGFSVDAVCDSNGKSGFHVASCLNGSVHGTATRNGTAASDGYGLIASGNSLDIDVVVSENAHHGARISATSSRLRVVSGDNGVYNNADTGTDDAAGLKVEGDNNVIESFVGVSNGASSDGRDGVWISSGADNTVVGLVGGTGFRGELLRVGDNDTIQAVVGRPSSDITAATTITLPYQGSFFTISGATAITSVTASTPGRVVTLKFASTPTFTDGSNLKLAGNLVASADATITLICDGTNWYEIARSVN